MTLEDLIDNADEQVAAVRDLYSWSTNYPPGEGPFTLYLDLIGYSEEQFGMSLSSLEFQFGYVELALLGHALTTFASRPGACERYIEKLLVAESEEA